MSKDKEVTTCSFRTSITFIAGAYGAVGLAVILLPFTVAGILVWCAYSIIGHNVLRQMLILIILIPTFLFGPELVRAMLRPMVIGNSEEVASNSSNQFNTNPPTTLPAQLPLIPTIAPTDSPPNTPVVGSQAKKVPTISPLTANTPSARSEESQVSEPASPPAENSTPASSPTPLIETPEPEATTTPSPTITPTPATTPTPTDKPPKPEKTPKPEKSPKPGKNN